MGTPHANQENFLPARLRQTPGPATVMSAAHGDGNRARFRRKRSPRNPGTAQHSLALSRPRPSTPRHRSSVLTRVGREVR